MKKSEFKAALKAYKLITVGAACFYDVVRDIYFCGPQLTHAQAEKFAQDHNLQLMAWHQGMSCTDVNCAGV